MSHFLEIVSSLIGEDNSLKEKYLSRRGEFLEDELFRLVYAAFPEAQLFRGSIWRAADGSEGENDLLAAR